MVAILRKDAAAGLLSLLVLWPVVAFAEILKMGGLDLGLVLFNSCLVILLTLGPALVNEIEEETNGGYRALDGLPAKRAEIVSATFLGAFLLTLAFATSHFALATFWSTDSDRAHHIHTVIISTGALSLSVLGIMYVGVFAFGLARAMSVFGISFWAVSAAFIVTVTLLGWNVDSAVGDLVEIVGRAGHLVTLSVGLFFFAFAWLTAVSLFRARSRW